MKKTIVIGVLALALISSESVAQQISECNASTKVCRLRNMTAQEQTAFDAAISKAGADSVKTLPDQPITRKQLAGIFRDCRATNSTPASILVCVADGLGNLEQTQ